MTQKVKNGDSKDKEAEPPAAEASNTAPAVSAGQAVAEVSQEDRQATGSRSAPEAGTTTRGLDLTTSLKAATSSSKLTDSERTMYASERLDNFRWLSKVAGRYAECPALTEKELVEEEVAKEIAETGQFAELVYSTVEVKSLFENHATLKDEKILLDYPVLGECDWVEKIFGAKMDLTAFVVFRRTTKQLVVSISGSSNLKHAIQNLRAVRMAWRPGSTVGRVDGNVNPPVDEESEVVEPVAAPAPPVEGETTIPAAGAEKDGDSLGGVHTGFFTLYKDVKEGLQGAIRKGIKDHAPEELVLTGHSMGGSVAYLLCMDLLSSVDGKTKDVTQTGIALPRKLCLTTFGAPRTGNAALVSHFHKLVNDWEKNEKAVVREYSVKAFNDGVPAVPPRALGYAHFCDRPLYAFRRKLYRVPEGQSEFSLFRVSATGGASGGNPDKPNDPTSASAPLQTNADVDGSIIRSPISKDGSGMPGDWIEVATSQAAQPALKPPCTGADIASPKNSFPRGGHNYYSGRDLEAFRRMTDRLHAANFPEANWEARFREGKKRASGVNK
ncbi:hypothetical protein H1R20_g3720, partial [Candolleomyces eurysporus]